MSAGASDPAQVGVDAEVTLSPAFRPVTAPGIGVADQATMLPMAADDDRGVVMAGCRARLHVFQLFSRQRLWFTITAHASLSGYALSAGVLYVQDGPVLSCWDLTTATLIQGQQTATGIRLAAINLVTKAAASGGATGVSDPQYAALFTAASVPACSAPVIRGQQIGGTAGAMVFVLGADGSLFAVDDGLTQVTAVFGARPGPLALGLTETVAADDPSQVTCTLAYVAQDTSLVLLDASGVAPKPAGTWPKDPPRQGPPVVDPSPPVVLGPETPAVAPQIIGDTVFACNVFEGLSLALCPLPPPTFRVFTWVVASPPDPVTGFSGPTKPPAGLEVSTTRQLVLLQGLASPLLSYAPGARAVERWPYADQESHRWVMFWEPGTDPTTRPGLILAVDQAAATGGVAFAVRVANTFDPPATDFYASDYPPPPATLVGGTLSLAPFTAAQVSAVLGRPMIVRGWLFALVADAAGAASLGGWPLAVIAAQALPAAAAELQRLALLGTPVPLKVFVGTADSGESPSIYQAGNPSIGPFTIDGFDGTGPDSSGNCPLPGTFWGQTITGHFGGHTGSVVATPGTQPVLLIDLSAQSPAPDPAGAGPTPSA